MGGINIGIVVKFDFTNSSPFSNGITQNAVVLRECLRRIDAVDNVYFVNLGTSQDFSSSAWNQLSDFTIDLKDAVERVNVLLTGTVKIRGEAVDAIRKRGIKLVNLVMGNEYYAFCEDVLFKEDGLSLQRFKKYDALWLLPHHFKTNKDLSEALHGTKAQVCPFIWSPEFIEKSLQELSLAGQVSNTRSSATGKRISIFEPNINMVKTSVFPMVIAEKLNEKKPELVESVNIFCLERIAHKKHFQEFATSLALYESRKSKFMGRKPIVWALSEHTDMVLSHQQDNSLNYLYFDVAWMGYPLVHNAHMIKELGFYYPDFDADEAVKVIMDVIENVNGDPTFLQSYLQKSRDYISNFLPGHSKNVSDYKALLEKLFEET